MSLLDPLINLFSGKPPKMNLQEIVNKYLADEYLNVQDKAAHRAQVLAELQTATGASAPAAPAPAGGSNPA